MKLSFMKLVFGLFLITLLNSSASLDGCPSLLSAKTTRFFPSCLQRKDNRKAISTLIHGFLGQAQENEAAIQTSISPIYKENLHRKYRELKAIESCLAKNSFESNKRVNYQNLARNLAHASKSIQLRINSLERSINIQHKKSQMRTQRNEQNINSYLKMQRHKDQRFKLFLSKTKNLTDAGNLIKSVLQTIISLIPQEFCWKRDDDNEKDPSECPFHYERNLGFCYETCKFGFQIFSGVCWEVCEPGKGNNGLICWKSLHTWHFRKSYVPNFLTNRDSLIKCPNGMYKKGDLCYRDCEKMGFKNCGLETCALHNERCDSPLAGMKSENVILAGTHIWSLLSLDKTEESSEQEAKLVSKIKNTTIKGAYLKLKEFIKLQRKHDLKNFTTMVAQQTKKMFRLLNKFTDSEILKTSELVIFFLREILQKEVSYSFLPIDFLGILKSINGCNQTIKSEEEFLECEKDALKILARSNSSGILSLATLFRNPICEVKT